MKWKRRKKEQTMMLFVQGAGGVSGRERVGIKGVDFWRKERGEGKKNVEAKSEEVD